MDAQSEALIYVFLYKGWLIPLCLISVTTALIYFLVTALVRSILPRCKKGKASWHYAILQAITSPLQVAILLFGISLMLQVVTFHFARESLYHLFRPLLALMLVILAGWFSLRLIGNIESDYIREQKGKKRDETTIRAICRISRIVVLILAVLVYLQSQKIDISAVLAFGGAGGLIAGFAAKDLLSNFFGGVIIYFDRPFSAGDLISSPDREIKGHVEHIGWRLTRIRTLSKRPLYVPNGIFSNICVENLSRMSHREIQARIGIRYADASKMQEVVTAVEAMIRAHPAVDTAQKILVRFDEFGASSLNFLVQCFTKATQLAEYTRHQQDIYIKIMEIIEKCGARCALPTFALLAPGGFPIRIDSPNTALSE